MKGTTIIYAAILLLILFATVGFFLWQDSSPQDGIRLDLYDANKNKIESNSIFSVFTTQAQTYNGVRYIVVHVKATNDGQIPLDLHLDNVAPDLIGNTFTLSTVTVPPGSSFEWTSSLIDLMPFEGTSQIIQVTVSSTDSLSRTIVQTQTLPFSVQSDPAGSFILQVGIASSQPSTTTIIQTTIPATTTISTSSTTTTICSGTASQCPPVGYATITRIVEAGTQCIGSDYPCPTTLGLIDCRYQVYKAPDQLLRDATLLPGQSDVGSYGISGVNNVCLLSGRT